MKKRETKHPNRNRLGMQTTFKDSLWQKAIERPDIKPFKHPRNPDIKPFKHPSLQAAGLQACAQRHGKEHTSWVMCLKDT